MVVVVVVVVVDVVIVTVIGTAVVMAVAIVVVKDLWAGAVIKISVGVSTIDVWAGVVVINVEVIASDFGVLVPCFDTVVELFVNALLIRVIFEVVTGVGADMLAEVNTNVLAGVMTALEFAISEPFKEFGC